jgi:hypothetical protein
MAVYTGQSIIFFVKVMYNYGGGALGELLARAIQITLEMIYHFDNAEG